MTETLTIMPREMRMMSERIFSLTPLPKGFALMLSDLPMYSQLLGLGGFALFESLLPDLMAADPTGLRLTEAPGRDAELAGAGLPAWLALPSVLDLLGEALAHSPDRPARLRLRALAQPGELALAQALGARLGLAITCQEDGAGGALLIAQACPAQDPVMAAALAHGTPIAADLWWRIYGRAKSALAPDTAVSRRHAGVIIVNDDGTVIGRKDNDDDSDVGFLARAGASPAAAAPAAGSQAERTNS